MEQHQELEERIKEIGAVIYSSAAGAVPSVFDKKRWQGKVMEWVMKDEAFKIQLFRFIDVLPALKTDALVVRLLKEFFGEESHIPNLMKRGIKGIPKSGLLPMIAGKAVKANVKSLAKQFIAGRTPEDSVDVLNTFRKDGFAFSIDLLGEVVVSDKEAREYTERYLSLLDYLDSIIEKWPDDHLLDADDKGKIPKLNISLKVSSFYSQLKPMDWEGSIENTKNGLRPVLRKARDLGASVTFDMEHYRYKDLTIAIFKSLLEEDEFEGFPFAGIAIQVYLKDTKKDLIDLIDWAEQNKKIITIRLVKGAYWDYETVVNRLKGWPVPVFLNKEETDFNFEELTELLLTHTDFIRPAFATHNIRSISKAIALTESLKLSKESIEFQTLYGMAEPLRDAIKEMNYRVRVYTPVGEFIPGMAYLVRRLLENTSNESFLRKSFVEQTPFEELINRPKPPLTEDDTDRVPENAVKNEPPTDFSKTENREQMKAALKVVKEGFDKRYPLFIGGKEIFKDKEIISVNPAKPQEVIGRVSSAGKDDAEKALQEAWYAWREWKKVSPGERAEFLFTAAKEMRKIKFDLMALEVYEVGKSWMEADGDVAEAIDFLEYYGNEMIRLGTPRQLGGYPGETNEYFYEPRGVGVVISPWNFPLAIPAGMVSASIVTGNCVILKPSGQSPVVGWKLVDIFRNSGLPDGVLQFLPGSGEEVGDYLVTHKGVDFIAFTGSKDVGLRMVELAGKTLSGQRNVKKVIAEMGGKNTIIVDETADLDEAVKGVLESALGYQGQKCSACSRVVVVEEAFDEFSERLKEAMESVKIGPPEEPGNIMGPVVDEGAFKKIKSYIEIGKKEGKAILINSEKREGYFIGPTIFVDVAPDSTLAQEEIFGPVIILLKAGSIEEAIKIANNTIYALTGGIFSRHPNNIKKVREEMNVGNLYINRKITGALVGRQPFGGFAMSGVGSKAGGPDYLLQFMNPKSINENTLRRGFAPSLEVMDEKY